MPAQNRARRSDGKRLEARFNTMKRVFILTPLFILCLVVLNLAQEKSPKVLKYQAPKFPPAAQATRTGGEVIVGVEINEEGKTISAKTESGHPLLRTSAEAAARQWLFSGSKNATRREIKITFVFSIRVNNNPKNNYKTSKCKIRFRKYYRLEIVLTEYPRISY